MKHYISIGLTVFAGALSLAALPFIADAAANRHIQNPWAAHAHNLGAAQGFEGHAAMLTTLHTGSADMTVWERDAARMQTLEQVNANRINLAQNKSAQTQCLAQAVYYEARSETLSGQKAVAEVVLNRVASKHFPSTICGVIYEGAQRSTGCQFSFTCDGSMDTLPSGTSWERAQDVAEHMMLGANIPKTQNATHYHTTQINPDWASYVKPTRTIGSHKFYKFKTRRELAMTHSVAP